MFLVLVIATFTLVSTTTLFPRHVRLSLSTLSVYAPGFNSVPARVNGQKVSTVYDAALATESVKIINTIANLIIFVSPQNIERKSCMFWSTPKHAIRKMAENGAIWQILNTNVKDFRQFLKEEITLYRAGKLSDPLGRGIFLTTDPEVAKSYSPMHGDANVHEYRLRPGARVKDAENRWQLVKELDPKWDKDKIYDRFISDQRRNNMKLVNGVTAEHRLTVEAEKRIIKALRKQGYHAARYSGGLTDQSGEYQVFDAKDLDIITS